MSLLNPAYRAEVMGGIRAAGVDRREVVLTLPAEQMRARIDADRVDTGARQWRQDHVAQALSALGCRTDALFIDASAAPELVAEAVVDVSGPPRG